MDLGFFKTFRRLLILGILLGVFFVSLTSVTRPAHAATGTNQTINFQGRLLTSSGAAVPDGYYNIQFKVYQDGDGLSVGDTTGSPTGSLKWTESYLNSASHGVRVFNGYMSVQLGSVTPFGSSIDWNQDTLWLSMNIGSTNVSCTPFTSCTPDGEMTPMQPLTSAVYALNSNQLGGLTSAAYGQLAATQTWTAANIFQPTGNVTGVKVIQSSAGAPTADIFNVQSANNTNLIQVTGSSANNAAITLRSLGGTNAITLNSAGALNFTGAAASVWDIGNNTLSLQTTNNGAITTGSGLLTVGGSQTFSGANPVIGTSTTNTGLTVQTNGTGTLTLNTTGAGTVNVGTTNTTTVGIGNNTTATTVTSTGGGTVQTIANAGETIKSNGNSATAFSVQNSSSATILGVDASTGRVGVGTATPGAALEVTGDVYLTKEAARVIKVADSTTATTAGGALSVIAGKGNSGAGGSLTLAGGGALTSGAGGSVNINGGASPDGTGGSVSITSGGGLAAGGITLQTASFFGAFGTTSINASGGKVTIGSTLNGFNVDTNQNLAVNGGNITQTALAVPVIGTASTGSSFYYAVTAINGQGETLLSNSVGMASSSAAISWGQVPGATGYKVYRNTSNSFTSGSLLRTTTSGVAASFTDNGAATGAGLPPTTVTGTKATLQAWSGQTANLQEWQSSAGTVLAGVSNAGVIFNQTASANSTVLQVQVSGDSQSRYTVDNTGRQSWGPGNATTDVTLDRTAANTLRISNNTGATAGNGGILQIGGYYGPGSYRNAVVISGGSANSFKGSIQFLNSGTPAGTISAANTGGVSNYLTLDTTLSIAGITSTAPPTVAKLLVGTPAFTDNAANVILTSSATGSKPLVIQGLSGQTANLQEWQNNSGSPLASIDASGNIAGGTYNTNTLSASALTFSGTNPVIGASTTNTGVTLQSNGTGTLTLNSTGAGTVNVGTTNSTTIGVGNTTAATTTTIQGGTGATAIALTQGTGGGIVIGGTGAASTVAIQCGAGTATSCGFANNATDHTTTVGSTTGTSLTTIQSGSGGISLSGAVTTSSTINTNTFGASALTFSGTNAIIGASTTNTNLAVQANGTGTLALNTSGAGTVNVGTGNSTTIGVGNTTAATTTTIQGGTGASAITLNQGTGGGIIIGGTGAASTVSVQCGAGTATACGFATNATDHTTTIGTTTGTGQTIIQSGSGGISLNGAVSTSGLLNGVTLSATALTFSGANPVIGASTSGTGVTLQSNGTGTLTLNSTGAGTVNVGTTNTTTVGIGNSTAATTVTSTGGATVQTVANGGVTVKTNTNSATAFQVQNSSGVVLFGVDTANNTVGTVNTATASTASGALSLQSGSTTGVTSNSGNVTIASGAASTSGNTGSLTLATGNASVGNSGSITLDVGTAPLGTVGTIAIGGTNALSTTIGNTTGTSAVTIQSGTGNLNIQTQGTGTLGIATNAVAQNITIGNSTGATTVAINCGTGVCTLGSNGIAHATTVGSATGAAATTVQAGSGGLNIESQGTVSIGNNAVAQTINLGNATGATTVAVLCGTGTCGFGNNATTHSTTVGSATSTSATTIQAGSGGLSIQSQGGTLGIGNNAVAQTLVIGNSTGGTAVAINCGTGSCDLGSNATDHSTTVGSTTGTSATTIQGGTAGVVINSNVAINGTVNTNTLTASALTFSGTNPVISASTTNTNLSVQANGTGTLTLNSTGAGTVNVGTANTTTVGIGNNTAATTTTITGGTGTGAVSIQSGIGGTISIGTATAGNTIQIGSITGNVTQSIGIGNNATATSINTVAIGSLLTSSSTLIQGGTGASAIVLSQGTGGGITIGGTGAASTVQIQCGAGTANTCGFANNATDHTTYVGSLSGTSVTNIQSGLGGISLAGNVTTTGTINTNTFSSTALTFTGTNPVISASTTNSNLTLQANGTGTLTLNTSGAGTVNVGTSNTTTVAVGNTGGGATVTLTGGATTTTVANAGETVKTSTNSTTAFQVQNSAGAAILAVNTSTPQVSFTATAANSTAGTPLVNTSYTSTSTTAGAETAQSIILSDTGAISSGSGTDTSTGVSIAVTHTGQTSGTIATNGISLQVNTDNAGAATSTTYGLNSLITGSADTGYGVAGGFLAAGSATTTNAIGVQGGVGTFLFSGSVTNAVGVSAYVSSTGGAGSIGTGYGVQVASASVGSGGTIGANYGIQVQPQTVGTTNYGVAIGTATTQTLQVGYDADGTTANAGISFGLTANKAANLYRGADNQLKTDSDFLVKSGTNSIAALSVQNSSGTNIFAVDTINGTVGTVKTTTASSNSQALALQSGTVVGTGSTSGNVSLQSGASTVSGNTGSLTLASGNAASGNSGSITLDVGTATGGTLGSISIGTANAQTIGVGNTTAGTAVAIQGGTGASAITLTQGTGGRVIIGGSGAASTVSLLCGAGTSTNCGFANNATDHTTVIGSNTGTSATTVQGGSGALTLAAGSIGLNSATISTNQSSVSFMDTTVTTVTALQSATSITMGATSGTLTLRNANVVLGNAVGSGSFTNNGGTTNITLPLGDFPSGGSIGTNSSTVDIYTSISINQSTGSRTLTIPTPSANITYGRLLYLSNIGSASFTLGTATISAGTTATLVWANTTGGASWQFAGADASSILNQSTIDQTANFRISGTGRANTSFTAPSFDSITGAVGLGTANASAVNIGNATTATSITASCGTGTCAFGSNGTDHSTTLGSSSGVSATTISGGSGGIQAKATGTTAFQVQNASGTSVLVVDTTNRQLKVMENAGSTNYALIYYNTATSTANFTANSGTVAVGTGAGAISIQAGSGSGITITSNAAALWSTTAGTLTLQSGTNSNLILTPSGTGMATISGASKLVLGQSAGDPATCTAGALVYNTSTNTLRGCQGSTPTWNDVINVTTPTMQSTYTASTGGTTAEVKLDTTRGALDIQGDNAGAVTDLFNVRAGTASGLGTSLFNVASSGDMTIQSSAGIAELSTSNVDVTIGQGATAHSTNPVVLILDSYQPITGTAATEQDGAMYYNADQNIFMCGNNGAWTNCAINQIQSSYVFEDEFLGGTTSAATGTSFQGVGALGWNVNATTSCAAAYNQTGPALTHDHPGTLRLTTAAVNGNGCAMTQAGTAAGTATLSQVIGVGDVFKTNIAIGAQTGTMRMGWTNQTSNTAPTSGAWWEYVNGSDATHLRYCYANNGAATCAAGPVLAANTWAELEIYINATNNITFVTNIGGTPTSVTTTNTFDPGTTNKLGPTTTCYASTTTALNCYVDYIQWSGVNTATHGVRD